MTTSYPSGLDSFTNPTATDETDDEIGTRTHSEFHADTNDAIEAIEAELGTDPSGSEATVKARIAATETVANAALPSASSVAADSLRVWGHSYGVGTGATTPTVEGFALVVAEALGLPLRNEAIGGTTLSSQVGGGASWVSILQKVTRPRRFVSPGGGHVLIYGLNDLNERGNTALAMAGFKHSLRSVVSRMRAGAIFENDNASFAYPTGSWADLTSTAENSGAGYKYTTGNATFTITTPADFPGGTIAVGVTARAGGAGATITATVNSILYTLDAHNDQTVGYIPCVLRIPNVPAGAQTITFTVASVVSLVGVDYWQWEPPEATAPLVALITQPYPVDYDAYGSVSPGPPTNAGVDVLNQIINDVADEFDARVVVVDTSTMNASTASYFIAGNIHPNTTGHRKIGELVAAAVAPAARFRARPQVTRPREEYGTAAPTGASTYWYVGDRVINTAPAEYLWAGSTYVTAEWRCTVEGAPGTWVAIRTLTGTGPLSTSKGSDQALATTDTTLVDVTGMALTIPAAQEYTGQIDLLIACNSVTPDLKLALNASGATGLWDLMGPVTTATGLTGDGVWAGLAFGSSSAVGTFNGTSWATVRFTALAGGSPVSLQLQAAQNTSDAGLITIKSSSRFTARRTV